MNKDLLLVADLLTEMEAAIKLGEWKIDGAADPDMVMRSAERRLTEAGYKRHYLDNHWHATSASP